MSHAQRRMWVLARMGGRYHIPAAVRLRGDLDRERLLAAIHGAVNRHQSLRTRFVLVGEELRQRVCPDARVDVRVTEMRGASEERVREVLRLEERRPFDLAQGPLVRVTLMELGPQEVLLVVVLHHIASDGESMGTLLRDVTWLYQGFPLPELRLQYRDYARWQLGLLEAGAMQPHLEHWRSVLAEELSPLDLPADRTRPLLRNFAGDRVQVALKQAELPRLMELGARNGASLFMILLALVKVLLYRYTGQEDVVVGSPVSGRTRAELEGQVGLFVNTVVLRDAVRGDESFEGLLQRVRETALRAYQHQVYPFDLLVEDVAAPRDLGRNPLFDVMVSLAPESPLEVGLRLPGIDVTPFPLDSGESKFDLTFGFAEAGGSLGLSLEYSTELFERAGIERMAVHFQTLVRSALADPSRPVGQLEMLTPAEAYELGSFHGRVVARQTDETATDETAADETLADETVTDRFEQQVRQTPEAVAVRCGETVLTYHEVDQRAEILALCLRGLGAGPEVRVGLCLDPAPDLVVGVLGILKAGAVYVPLDPGLPSPRLAFLMADTQAAVVITQASLLERLPHTQARVLCLDRDWPEVVARAPEPAAERRGRHAAYVIYTSGSTGEPKGVVVEHASLNHYLHWADAYYFAGSDGRGFPSLHVGRVRSHAHQPVPAAAEGALRAHPFGRHDRGRALGVH